MLLLLWVQGQALADDTGPPQYRIYHPDNPPWGSTATHGGFIVNIVEKAFQKAGLKSESVYAPWKREQAIVQTVPNRFMAPLTRLKHREKLYIWVAPINISYLQLVTRSQELAALPLSDLRQLPVAGRMESPAEFKLKTLGFQNVTLVTNEEAAARLVLAGRITLWMQRGLPGNWAYQHVGGAVDDLKVVRFWPSPLQYLVASPGTSPEVVSKLRHALEQMRNSGEIDRIKQAYFNHPLGCDLLLSCEYSREKQKRSQ